MRELREFREAYPSFEQLGVVVAGVSTDTLESHAKWIERLRLPYPLLSDPERTAGRALGLVRRVGIGAWGVELFRRATLLVDARGVIAAAWSQVKVRGHAAQVLEAARAMIAGGEGGTSRSFAEGQTPQQPGARDGGGRREDQ